jgi:PAS domain S-box-containing protein
MIRPGPSRVSILVADGEPEEVALLVALLIDHGYEVEATKGGEAALEAVRHSPPDLILLGVPLPDVDTFQLCERLKADEKTRDVPVVIILPQGEANLRSRVFTSGADYVMRPLEGAELLARVRTQLTWEATRERLVDQEARAGRPTAELPGEGVLKNLREILYEVDGDGVLTYVSPAVESVLGYGPSEIVGSHVDQFMCQEDVPRLRKTFQRVLAGHPAVSEYRIVTHSGEVRWMRTSSQPVYEGDLVTSVQGVLADITERKQAEEEIERLARFPSENPNPVLRVAADGVVLYANGASSPLLDVWGCQVGERLPDEWRDLNLEVLDSRRSRDAEVEVVDRVFSLTFAPVTDAGYVNVYGLDITERKQAEGEIERLARFPSENPNPVLRVAADGVVLYANGASSPLLDVWGCQVGDPLPDEWRDFNLQVLDSRRSRDAEVEVGDRVFSLTFAPVTDAGYVNVYGLDITERKQAEEALKRSRERYELAERAANIGSWDWDIRTGDLYWTTQIESMFGLPPGAFEGTYNAFLGRVHPEDRQYVMESVNACVEWGADYAIEHRIKWPDGTVRWVSESGDVIRDDGGQALRMLGVVQDITGRKGAEEQIQRQNAFLTSVLESLAHPFYVVDAADYTVQMANTAAYPGALPEHATCYGLFHGRSSPCVEAGSLCPMEEIRRTGEHATVEHVHRDAEGNRRTVEVRGYPVFDDEGDLTRVIEYSFDVTERREAEEALRAAKEAAEEARREEQKRRREVERRRQVAEGLADVVAALNSNQPLDQVLSQIAAHASELLEADAVAICPPDLEGEPLSVMPAQCVFSGSSAGMDSPASRRALKRALALRQPVVVPDGGSPPLDVSGVEPFRALLVVPIIVQSEQCGGMLLYYGHPRSLSDDDIGLATVFGSKIALAIENTRLREEVQRAAASAERDRLARDLHDSVTQALFSASLVAEVLPRMWERDPEEAMTGLEELRQLTGGALAEMRTLLLELRPEALIETSLRDLLRQLSEATTSRTQISKTVDIGSIPAVPPDVHIAFYRVAQEALNNVVRHAGATELNLSLEALPPVSQEETDDWQGRLVLRVSDNGRGFDLERIWGDHLGLDIMRERAATIGAALTIDSQPDQGTQVVLVWENNRAGDST